MVRHLVVALIIAITLPSSVPNAALANAQRPVEQEQQCFVETGQCIGGRFREYWQQHGGLDVFGFPITAERSETTPEGTFVTQYFERNRFELHPELTPPFDVSLGRLGDARLQQQGRNWFTFPQGQQSIECRWFAQTSHSVCEPFRSYWERKGRSDPASVSYAESMALFGMPLSEPTMETNGAGDMVLTQWFERARFEYHPDNSEPFKILLGLLGTETYGSALITPEKCADIPPLLNADIRPSNCVLEGTEISFDIYGFRPNETIEFWLINPDGNRDGPEQTYMVGVSGAIDGLDFDTTGLAGGVWTWYFRGRGSDHESIIPFKVVPRP